jgi:hypothetical protein
LKLVDTGTEAGTEAGRQAGKLAVKTCRGVQKFVDFRKNSQTGNAIFPVSLTLVAHPYRF